MGQDQDRRFSDVAQRFQEWRSDLAGQQRPCQMMVQDDSQRVAASPMPHQLPATGSGAGTVADQLADDWATTLATRVVARDPETLADLDLPAHDRTIAAALKTLQQVIPAGEQHHLRTLLDLLQARDLNLITMVGYQGWEAGYNAAVDAFAASAESLQEITEDTAQ